MENYEIGIFLYYVLTGIFIYLCVLIVKNNDKNNKHNK
jgi:hypothetical protein